LDKKKNKSKVDSGKITSSKVLWRTKNQTQKNQILIWIIYQGKPREGDISSQEKATFQVITIEA